MCAHVLREIPRRKLRGNSAKCTKCGRFITVTDEIEARTAGT